MSENDWPTQTPSIAALAAALAKAQGEMKPAMKSSENPFFKNHYADLPACWESARSAMASNGLAVVQMPETMGDRNYLVTTLAHSSGEWMRSRWQITATKNDPQSLGSALTYFRRYSLCAAVGITAENEDDDGNAASTPPATTQRDGRRRQQPSTDATAQHDDSASPAMLLAECKAKLKEIGGITPEDFSFTVSQVTNGKFTAVNKQVDIARQVLKMLEDPAVFGAAKLSMLARHRPADTAPATTERQPGDDGP